jgi:hypothetical protein
MGWEANPLTSKAPSVEVKLRSTAALWDRPGSQSPYLHILSSGLEYRACTKKLSARGDRLRHWWDGPA